MNFHTLIGDIFRRVGRFHSTFFDLERSHHSITPVSEQRHKMIYLFISGGGWVSGGGVFPCFLYNVELNR